MNPTTTARDERERARGNTRLGVRVLLGSMLASCAPVLVLAFLLRAAILEGEGPGDESLGLLELGGFLVVCALGLVVNELHFWRWCA